MSSKPPIGLAGRGTEKLIIGDKGEYVTLHFDSPVEWVALDAETARQVAEQMARQSYKVKFGDFPTTKANSQITEQLRQKLSHRAIAMLRSMQTKPIEFQARELVDIVLKEVA